jgi:hypothetical protein
MIGFAGTLIAVILFFTNPGMEDFQEHFKQDMLGDAGEESPLVETIVGILEKPFWESIEPNTSRTNLFLFSVYKIEFEEEKFVYLGILDNFYRLDKE